MKRLVIVSDELTKDVLSERYQDEELVKYGEDIVVSTFDASKNKASMDFTTEDEVLVACKEENQAEKIASYLCEKLTSEQFANVICLEGYEGKHYFNHCVRTLKSLEESLKDIVDAISLPAFITLDYYDLQKMVQGTKNYITYFEGEPSVVRGEWEKFLSSDKVKRCMVNVSGDIHLTRASEILKEITEIDESAPVGMRSIENVRGWMRIAVIYSDVAI